MDYFPNPGSSSGEAVSFPAHTLMGCRLTLESGVPVSTTDQTAKSVVHLCQYTHDRVPLYGASGWESTVGHGLSMTLAGLTSGKLYDVVGYINSGTPVIDLMPAWTNDTTRASSVNYLNGIKVNQSSFTSVLNGHSVASQRATVLGLLEAKTSSTTEITKTSLCLANEYNTNTFGMFRAEGTSSWTYTTASYRKARDDSLNKLTFLNCNPTFTPVNVIAHCRSSADNLDVAVSIGLDSETVSHADVVGKGISPRGTAADFYQVSASAILPVGIGKHYFCWLEYGASTITFFGGNMRASGIYSNIKF